MRRRRAGELPEVAVPWWLALDRSDVGAVALFVESAAFRAALGLFDEPTPCVLDRTAAEPAVYVVHDGDPAVSIPLLHRGFASRDAAEQHARQLGPSFVYTQVHEGRAARTMTPFGWSSEAGPDEGVSTSSPSLQGALYGPKGARALAVKTARPWRARHRECLNAGAHSAACVRTNGVSDTAGGVEDVARSA